MTKSDAIVGQTFGRLRVETRLENHITPSGATKSMYLCRCVCGNTKKIAYQDLTSGKVKSCGCFNVESAKERFTTHGMTHTKAYRTWYGIKTRCFNSNSPRYKDYGGRGITMCKEWANSFEAFYDYTSMLPNSFKVGYSVDRIDNDGNYEPGNIKFSTPHEQNINTRRRKNAIKC